MSSNRQRDQLRRRQQQAWAAEQEKKRKRRRREARLQQSGGINISDVDNFNAQGDLVGRDKVHQINASYQRDEKSGFVLFIERVFVFFFSFGVALAIAVFIGAIFAGTVNPIAIIVGGFFALLFGFVSASNISRYRD